MKEKCITLLKMKEKTDVANWTMNANLPFYVVMKKPRPSLSKHDDEQPMYWHCDDAYYLLTAAQYAGDLSRTLLQTIEDLKDLNSWELEDHVSDRIKEMINTLEGK